MTAVRALLQLSGGRPPFALEFGECKLRQVEMHWEEDWRPVWERDDPWHPWGRVWLDHESGQPEWGLCDDPRRLLSESSPPPEVLNDPGRYEEIPPLSHGDHHEIFAEYRRILPDEVTAVCNPASIGGFRKDLYYHFGNAADEYWWMWCDFHGEALRLRAEAWLRARGVEPIWK